MPATNRILNPVVALTFVAAHTSTVRLGTGILLLPQHQPLILAKELATLDVLSGGRLMVGVGVGWAEEEFEALGVPFHERGARADEYLAAMRAIWSEEKPAYHGQYVSFQEVQAYPHLRVNEFVVGKQGKKEYPHLDKKTPSPREETHEWKRMSRYERY
jgi:probable F420-dependent oxidoreductase